MAHEPINSDGLPVPESWAQVVVASGTRTVFVASQVGEDETTTWSARATSEQARGASRTSVAASPPPARGRRT